jgi:8-oxo-dGTP diphosphatase
MDEQSYLKTYEPRAFSAPLFSIDAILFSYHEETLKVLLVQRSNHPDKGKWGLPGGFVDLLRDKCLEDTVLRKINEKTGVKPPYIEQLATIGNNNRDARGWAVTSCYSALMAYQDCEAKIESVDDVKWVALNDLNSIELAFDHQHLIDMARDRLKQKALYSIVPAYALPEKFTLPELQYLHEVLIGKPIQKKSFRRRIEQAELLIDTGEQRRDGGRPASLYRMRDTSKDFMFVRNLEV